MLIIKRKRHTRTIGAGIFNIIFNSAVKRVTNAISKGGNSAVKGVTNAISKGGIKRVVNSTIAHTVANSAIDGAVHATVENLLKRKSPQEETGNKRLKIEVNPIIDGGGIVLD